MNMRDAKRGLTSDTMGMGLSNKGEGNATGSVG